MNKNILLIVLIAYILQSCSAIKVPKKQSNQTIIQNKIEGFLYKINKRLNLKKKRISYHLDNTREYKDIIEQLIVETQTKYGYTVINRSYISALDIEQDLNNQEDTLKGVDIVIIAKSENGSIILKALTVRNENLLTMDIIKLEKKMTNMVVEQSSESLNYYDAVRYCKNDDKNIPNEYSAGDVGIENILFWTSKYTKNSDMAIVYSSQEQEYFEAIRADTFDVVCVGK